MKRYIRSSEGTADNGYREVKKFNQVYHVHTRFANDPEEFECTIEESHPMDLQDYYWISMDSPLSYTATVYRGSKPIDVVSLPTWSEGKYIDESDYVEGVIHVMCKILRNYNKTLEPEIYST